MDDDTLSLIRAFILREEWHAREHPAVATAHQRTARVLRELRDQLSQPTRPRVGARIRAARQRRGWRQQDLAARLGTTQAEVSRVELTLRTPLGETLRRYATALGVRAEWLRTGEGAMEESR